MLSIDRDELYTEKFISFVNGELALDGSDNFAMCYAGHQFGHFVPRLGDGRAINIGTVNGLHMQIKGAGQTKYSRSGDGRAVLRSSIREYLISEAMHGLGIETTRALAIIGSEHKVFRELWEMGSVVLRVSPSWVRFGTFEYFAHKKLYSELEALTDYVISESYPHLKDDNDRYLRLFEEVVERTAKLIAKWQTVGFSHGVMNSDNMSIAGLTIDYGPFAFMDRYEHGYICNHTDRSGRYSFGNQPAIAEWNLRALMTALSPLIKIDRMNEVLSRYAEIFSKHFLENMSAKIGLDRFIPHDASLIKHMLGTMESLRVDYTPFFRRLSRYDGDRRDILSLCLYHTPMNEWLDDYDARLKDNNSTQRQRERRILSVNPKYVLKNYMLQEAIDSVYDGDITVVEKLFLIAQDPYSEHEEMSRWAEPTPEEHANQKLSCSS